MAIVNRDLDPSEQNYVVSAVLDDQATGVSAWVGLVKSPGQIREWVYAAKGVSGTPVYTLAIARWTSGGITNIALGTSAAVAAAYGTSGGVVIGGTLASSSTLGAVQAGDLLVVNTGGSNAAVTDLLVDVVVKATQDIKKSHDVGQS